MLYRVDTFKETNINPITQKKYDDSWIIYILNNEPYKMFVGSVNRCAYTLKVSKNVSYWEMTLGDFISYNSSIGKNMILAVSENDYQKAIKKYKGHAHNEKYLREYEAPVLVHSTTKENYENILKDGCLKSWNQLHREGFCTEKEPIGKQLGDPVELRDFILFGNGITGEIVVSSKQSHKILMDENIEYRPGARLYFNVKKMAGDGLIIRDGGEIKVKDTLPLKPYLLWAATCANTGLDSEISTPKIFAQAADKYFRKNIASTCIKKL